MSSTTPAILLVGINGYGNLYVEKCLALQAQGKITIAGIVDPTAHLNRHIQELAQPHTPIVNTLDQFFDTHTHADLACIATPIGLHQEQACTALAHGLNVLCEKPAAGCLADAKLMAQAQDASGKFLAIGYQLSFSDSTQNLKKDILAGRFGAPIRLKTRVLWPRPLSYFARNSWAGHLKDSAGHWVNDSPVNNATAHYLHNLLYLLGDQLDTAATPTDLEAQLFRANTIETFDTCVLRAHVPSGAEILFYTSHSIDQSYGPEYHLTFEKATITCTGTDNNLSLTATLHDGTRINYGNPCDTYDNKLLHAIAKTANPSLPPLACTIRTALPHLTCIETLRTIPVHTFAPNQTHFQTTPEGHQLLVVNNLYQRLMHAYDHNTLLDLSH